MFRIFGNHNLMNPWFSQPHIANFRTQRSISATSSLFLEMIYTY